MINIYALISLLSFIICLILGVFVYLKHVRYVFDNELSRIFVCLCLSMAFCWALIEFGYRFANDFETAYFWVKINIAWYFVMSFLLHFSLIYTKNTKLLRRNLTYLMIYGPSVIFFLIDATTNLLLTVPHKELWGWTYGIPEFPILHGISSTWAAFTGVFCLYIFFEYIQDLNNQKREIQAKFVTIGLLIPVFIGLQTEWLFPLLNIRAPELLVPALSLGLVVISFAIWIHNPLKNNKKYETVRIEIDDIIKN